MPRIYSRNQDRPFYEVKFYSRQVHGPWTEHVGVEFRGEQKLKFCSSRNFIKWEIVEISYLSSDYRIFWMVVKFKFEILKRFNGFVYRYFRDP